MANVKKLAPQAPAPAPLTEEQKKEQIVRFLTQQRGALTQGVLFNLMQNPSAINREPAELAEFAVAVADATVAKLFPLPAEEKTEA